MKKKYESPLLEDIALLSNVIMTDESVDNGEDGDNFDGIGDIL